MKKLISLLLTFAMIFSLAMPAMAAEEDTYTYYIDISQVFDSSKKGILINIADNTQYVPAFPVSDSVYSFTLPTSMPSGYFTITSSDMTSFFGSYTSTDATKNLYTPTDARNGTWSVYGDTADAPTINGSTTGDVTASYTPTAKITGLYITVDGVEYNNENTSADAPATVYSDSIVTVTVYGENFANLPEDISPEFAFIYFGANIKNLYKNNTSWTIDTESNTATITAINSILASATAASELKYTNDRCATEPGSGVYVIYNEGTKPTTPDDNAEAKWGNSKDELTGSGTLAEAITAAKNDPSITYIQLQKNVTTDECYRIESSALTLDLNGKILTSNHSNYAIYVSGSSEVTLTDTAIDGAVISTGSYAVSVSNSKVVINGGSYTSSEYYAVTVDTGGALTINGGTFNAGNFASVATNGATTIKGGTFMAGSLGQIAYWNGTLDLSDYTGDDLTLSQWTDSDMTVPNETIKLPEGYAFKDGKGNNVTTLVYGTIYTIGVETSYTVAIADGINGGTVTVDKYTAKQGETVTVTVNAEAGYAYVVNSLSVTNKTTGEPVAVDEASKTFLMPDANVTVTVSFEKLSVTSAGISWGSMSFTYDDTIPEGKTEENGWSNDGSAGAGTVTVTNTGTTTTFTAQVAYNPESGYTEIEGTFDAASAELAAEASKTFTLTLKNKPSKAIPAGTKIGSVTITINEAPATETIVAYATTSWNQAETQNVRPDTDKPGTWYEHTETVTLVGAILAEGVTYTAEYPGNNYSGKSTVTATRSGESTLTVTTNTISSDDWTATITIPAEDMVAQAGYSIPADGITVTMMLHYPF